MAGDDFFQVVAEVFIQRDGRIALLGLTQDIGDGPSAAVSLR
jgi:hypothetical protein